MVQSTTTNATLLPSDLAEIATGRQSDFFGADFQEHSVQIQEYFGGRRVLILGGAGSIGGATTALVSEFCPHSLHIIDHNENALAELVRDLRSRPAGLKVPDFRAEPIDFGSPIMRRFLRTEASYDCVLNFAALKHVRSEKDICSILEMLDTNLLKPIRCWEWIESVGGKPPSYFSVSTDKAADPANLMGASKRIMEYLMFCSSGFMYSSPRTTSSRFANVAFSNGSLLESFCRRFEKRQPLACPRDTDRFFISLREAGQICLLAAACGPDRHIMIPRLNPRTDTRILEEIAVAYLRQQGLEAEIYRDELSARTNILADMMRNRYPLLLTELDTQGEKSSEVFAGEGEQVVDCGMRSVQAVRPGSISYSVLREFVREIDERISHPGTVVDKAWIVAAVASVVNNFNHVAHTHTLDQRV